MRLLTIMSLVLLTSAYYQVSIRLEEKIYTAFEVAGYIYQFCRIPFRMTNSVASFQKMIDDMMGKSPRNLLILTTLPAMDMIKLNNTNLMKFMDSIEKYNLTLNENKFLYSLTSVNLSGYTTIKKVQ